MPYPKWCPSPVNAWGTQSQKTKNLPQNKNHEKSIWKMAQNVTVPYFSQSFLDSGDWAENECDDDSIKWSSLELAQVLSVSLNKRNSDLLAKPTIKSWYMVLKINHFETW